MSAFTLGRMRHIELLALWHLLHPDTHKHDPHMAARLSKDNLAAAILSGHT